ncbi:5-hydroxytryptamine receptor 2A-like [Pristis pectinata]|uniref:5-hydroxytryptamine receptor 2A-like n=1 Tax=Pristis pectinata TaxID=685728 RepID=UPI00223D2975|nr:5-hydroxytryptamine receptor 2A-like [Pristis pectinata]
MSRVIENQIKKKRTVWQYFKIHCLCYSSVSLDFILHSVLMARYINSSYILNQSLFTGEILNASVSEDISHTAISIKNWPALLILVIIVLTVGGNILVIMAVSLEKKLQNATNYFLMSLAVADMLVGILVMPVSLITILYDNTWPFPEKLCPIWIYLDVLFSTASIMHLCAISLDRYIGIRNPIEHSRFNSRTIAIIKITAVWTISIGISMPILVIGLEDESRVFIVNSCIINEESFLLVGSFVAFFIPLIIMVFTYCLTVQTLQKQISVFLGDQKQKRASLHVFKKGNLTENAAMIQRSETPDKTSRSPLNKEVKLFRKGIMQSINNEQRASKVLGIVFFLFVVMWCPFFITNVLSVICKDSCDEAIIGDLLNVFVWVGYTSSGVNPLVYTLFNGAYRRAFSHYICCHYRGTRNHFTVVASTSAIHERNLEMTTMNNGNKSPSNKLRVPEERLHVTVESTVSSINNCIIISEKVSCV